MNETTELAAPSKTSIQIGQRGIEIRTHEDLWRFSQYVAKSGLAPKGIQTPEAIFVAVQMGLEVGLTPMASLQNIAVINGRPSIWGDAQLGIVRATGNLESFEEWYEESGKRLTRNPSTFADTVTAVCRVKRRGFEPVEVGFSVSDAKTAGLWGKDGPWRQYPARMLRNRARSFNLRDNFGDALKGLRTSEEVMDIQEMNVTPSVSPKEIAKLDRFSSSPDQSQTPTPEAATTQPDLKTKLKYAIDKAGATLDQFIEAMISDGIIDSPIANTIKSVSDIPESAVKAYAGNKQDFAAVAESVNPIVQRDIKDSSK